VGNLKVAVVITRYIESEAERKQPYEMLATSAAV
jgi:hypothetical protein